MAAMRSMELLLEYCGLDQHVPQVVLAWLDVPLDRAPRPLSRLAAQRRLLNKTPSLMPDVELPFADGEVRQCDLAAGVAHGGVGIVAHKHKARHPRMRRASDLKRRQFGDFEDIRDFASR